MEDKQVLLSELHQARLDRLKEICAQHGISKNGSVEVLRAKLIAELVLTDWDLSPDGIDSILNNDLGDVLAVFGVKKSGSIRERRQRLFLHLNLMQNNLLLRNWITYHETNCMNCAQN